MILDNPDVLVGSLSMIVGGCLLWAASSNWQWYYSLRSARFLQSRLGRFGARCFHAGLGLALIALGVAIIMGYQLTPGG